MSDTRDNHQVSRVSVSSHASGSESESQIDVPSIRDGELSQPADSLRKQHSKRGGSHASTSDPRRFTVAASKFHPVSLEGAGPRAQHQRRPVMEGGTIPKRRARSSTVRETALLILIPAIIVVLCRLFIFDLYVIPSGSMMDTLQVGDRIITSKLTPSVGSLKRGDIVVFKDPANWLGDETNGSNPFNTEYLVKRLIGLPGDHVKCCTASGNITINGEPIYESSYIRPGVSPSTIAFDVTVTKDHIFVLGDNRSNSADSRYHSNDGANGLVPISDVAGVAKFVYWPLNHFSHLARPDSVFANVPDPSTNTTE